MIAFRDKMRAKGLHCCLSNDDQIGYGDAFNYCIEEEDGRLLVENSEYGNYVNFCPMCGYESKNKNE